MNHKEIAKLLNARIITGEGGELTDYQYAFASDLMSDVLTVDSEQLILITGLANLQAIRTAEMSDISCIVIARGKKATEEMIQLAIENKLTLIECNYTMFKTSGILYNSGLKALY
jgi:predicted transcriptional regulator